MRIIDLKDVSFIRDGNAILRDFSWAIEKGEHWAMVGANGSGKTTVLRIAAGYSFPTDGEVRILGETLGETDMPCLRKMIGWVNSAFREWLPVSHSALEIVLSGIEASVGLYCDFEESQIEKAREALRSIGCLRLAERRYGTLSQGEQQRVLIARALINEPLLLILDEPCAGLDPVATERFLADIETLAKGENSPTVVFVTHKIEEIRGFMSRAILMKDGRALAAGPIGDVITTAKLSDAFGCNCVVFRENGQYSLSISID